MTDASIPKPRISFQFASSDLDEFRELIGRNIRPCRFQPRPTRYETELRHHRVGDLGFSVVSVGPEIDVFVDPVEDSYLLQSSLEGSFEASCLEPWRVYDEGDTHVVNPKAPLRVAMHPGARLLLTRIPRTALEEHARVLGDESVIESHRVLPEALPSAGRKATSLRRYLEFLHAESMDPDSALHEGTAIRAAEQMLISLMLGAVDGAAPARPCGDVSTHVRRAEDYIDGHLDKDIGLVDIVRTAGVDARTLEAGFRRRRGAGPLSWLEQRRGERAGRGAQQTPRLTPRELEIGRLVATGLNNGEIGRCLAISRNTVKEALKRIFRKLDVDSRAELVTRLAEAGLLQI
jgi:DNA-binding CsgD family transcriptional regulator